MAKEVKGMVLLSRAAIQSKEEDQEKEKAQEEEKEPLRP